MDRRSLRPGPIPALALAALLAGCGGSPSATGTTQPRIEIVAEGIAFRPARLELPADTTLTFVLVNRDAGVPHGVLVMTRTSGVEPTRLGESEIATGPARLEFSVTPLPAGPYLFSCPVHPNMQIEVDVGPSGI